MVTSKKYYQNILMINVPVAPTTWDPLTTTNVSLSGGNLIATNTAVNTPNQGARVATGKSSGKNYFELAFTNLVDASGFSQTTTVGICMTSASYSGVGSNATNACVVNYFGSVSINSSGVAGIGARASGDVIGVAIDQDNHRIWFRVTPSGNWNGNGSANPATNTGGVNISALTGALVPICTFGGDPGHDHIGNITTGNFGSSPFVGTVPIGFIPGW